MKSILKNIIFNFCHDPIINPTKSYTLLFLMVEKLKMWKTSSVHDELIKQSKSHNASIII